MFKKILKKADFISKPSLNKLRFDRKYYEKSVTGGIITILIGIYLGYSFINFAYNIHLKNDPIIHEYTEKYEYDN